MKTLGILGGMGPLATAYFSQLLVEFADAKTDREHLKSVVVSIPQTPDRTEYLLKQSNESPLYAMCEGLKLLEKCECDVIAIPCVTAHCFNDELKKNVSVPIINAVEETALYYSKCGVKKVGLMATNGTVRTKIFEDAFNSYGIELIVPDEINQEKITSLIYEDVKTGNKPDIKKLMEVVDYLEKCGAESFLLGCTELSIIKRDNSMDEKIVDVLDILAKASLKYCEVAVREND